MHLQRASTLTVLGIAAFATSGVLLAWFIVPQTKAPITKIATPAYPVSTATIGNQVYTLWTPQTAAQKQDGLGVVRQLAPLHGMLFMVQSSENPYGIWMKGMHFPIDILWLDAAGQVIYVAEGAQPASYPTVFRNPPGTTAAYVIEVPSGTLLKEKIVLGSMVLVQATNRNNAHHHP